jgi:hypothetical protein
MKVLATNGTVLEKIVMIDSVSRMTVLDPGRRGTEPLDRIQAHLSVL